MSRFYQFCQILTCLVAALLGACSDSGVTWSDTERQNARYLFESIAAAGRAADLANSLPAGTPDPLLAEPVIIELEKALNFALLVNETVLQKAHPELPHKFHNQYLPALNQLLRYYRTGQLPADARPAQELRAYTQWFIEHQYEFRW